MDGYGMRLLSWNVNGLRAVLKKGFADFVNESNPDVLCLQEIKAMEDQVDFEWPEAYSVYWNSAERKGYSGTLVASKVKPIRVWTGIGNPEGDAEGRVQTLEFEAFYLVNVYTPNSKSGLERLHYRTTSWDVDFRRHCAALAKTKSVVFCGDLNVAHEEIDLANPKTNRMNAGFTDEERAAFGEHLREGFIDSYRALYPEVRDAYSWWSYRMGARARNVGWRIDYFCLSKSMQDVLSDAFILQGVMGSDHCPVGVELAL